jgi:hypothetical protein
MFILLQSHYAIIIFTSDNIKVFIKAIIFLLFKGHAVAVQSALPFRLRPRMHQRARVRAKKLPGNKHTLSHPWLYISLRPFSISLDISHSPPTSASASARECITISGVAL